MVVYILLGLEVFEQIAHEDPGESTIVSMQARSGNGCSACGDASFDVNIMRSTFVWGHRRFSAISSLCIGACFLPCFTSIKTVTAYATYSRALNHA